MTVIHNTYSNPSVNAKNSCMCIVLGKILLGMQFDVVVAENDLQQKTLQQ